MIRQEQKTQDSRVGSTTGFNSLTRSQRAAKKVTPPITKKKLDTLRASAILTPIHEENHHARLGEYTAQLYKTNAMTDVVVVVEGQEFKAHKAVLACYSPYFKEVLVKPGGYDQMHYVQIPSLTSVAFKILLEYMYTGELNITCQELSDVYRAARRLGMQDALGKCIEMMAVTPDNIENMVNLYVTARKLNILDASIRAFKLMGDNFEHLITCKEFLDLEVEQLIELLSVNEIGTRSEILVFLAGLKWINHKYLEREEHVTAIMRCVRFTLMNMEEVMACYHPPLIPGIVLFPEIRNALLNATCYIAAKSKGQESLFSELADRPRKFLFEGEEMVLWDISMFDPSRYKFSKVHRSAAKIQAAFRGYITRKFLKHDLCIANRAATKIQAQYRGYKTRQMLHNHGDNLLRNYMLEIPRRSSLKSSGLNQYHYLSSNSLMPQDINYRRPEQMNKENRVVYIMGGVDINAEEGNARENTLFSFKTEKLEWKEVTKCPQPLIDFQMVMLSGSLYVIGGCNPMSKFETGKLAPLNDCYKYQLERNEWISLPSMNHSKSYHGTALLGESIYVAGGRDHTNNILSAVETYNLIMDCWITTHVDMPEPRMAMGFTAHQGKLWIAGGATPDGKNDGRIVVLDSVQCLDLRMGRWVTRCSLPQPTAFTTLLSYGDQLLCVGGCTRNSNPSGALVSMDTIYSYEVRRDYWSLLTTMPLPCHNAVVCSSGRDLFILGGINSQTMSNLPRPQFYDSRKGSWQKLDNLPVEAHGFITSACSFLA